MSVCTRRKEESRLLICRILASHCALFGSPLYNLSSNTDDALEELHLAPYALLSHGLGKDPLFTYGNQTALGLFELTDEQILCTPSRTSAEKNDQASRGKFMQSVKEKGYAEGYSCIRVSSTGKKFKILNASIWNILDDRKVIIGQAAAFMKWENI